MQYNVKIRAEGDCKVRFTAENFQDAIEQVIDYESLKNLGKMIFFDNIEFEPLSVTLDDLDSRYSKIYIAEYGVSGTCTLAVETEDEDEIEELAAKKFAHYNFGDLENVFWDIDFIEEVE